MNPPDEKEFHLAAFARAVAALDALRKQQAAGQQVEWAAVWLQANEAADHALELSRLWAATAEEYHQLADGTVPGQ